MVVVWEQVGVAFVISFLIVLLALWRQWLSRSGALGAMIVGTLTMGFGGWVWGVLLGVFFVSSSLLSHFKEEQKRQTAAEKFEKGAKRDIMQAFANGGVGAVIAVLSAIAPADFWFPLFLGIMGTVTADTWATELGTLSKRAPRLITSGRRVEVGTSGGITPLGTAVSFVGGLVIGLAAAFFMRETGWQLVLVGGCGGLAGSLLDSLLGATLQLIYWDDVREKETEKAIKDGRKLQPLRGWRWLNNDMVNLLSSIGGGVVAVVVALLLGV
jgi:uncharacterized protein (TIGR00297 family)